MSKIINHIDLWFALVDVALARFEEIPKALVQWVISEFNVHLSLKVSTQAKPFMCKRV